MVLESLPLWLDLLLSVLVVAGAFFALVGSLGLVKLSDFLKRVHGPTKATTLGVGCVLIASSIWFSIGTRTFSAHEFLITLFLFLTAPVSAHMLVKTAMYLDPSLRPAPPPASADAAPGTDGPAARPDVARSTPGQSRRSSRPPGKAKPAGRRGSPGR